MPSVSEQESRELIEQAVKRYPTLAMTTGLNLSGVVLLDIAAEEGFLGDLVFVDTGFHFPQTLALWNRLAERYRAVNFVTLNSQSDDIEREPLYQVDPAGCCATNKVQPLNEYLAQRRPQALLNARTQSSAATRANLGPIEPGDPIRINPLYAWHQSDLEAYAEQHSLEVHPLYREGFVSLGCWPCTRAVRPGEDVRAGRFDGQGRTECGIWTQDTAGPGSPINRPTRKNATTAQGVS